MIDKNENYNKVLCLNLYGKMLIDLPNRSSEGESFFLIFLLIFF